MSDKMYRLQKLIEDDPIVRKQFTQLDIPRKAYEMINYVLLPFDDHSFNNMILGMTIDKVEKVAGEQASSDDVPFVVDFADLLYLESTNIRILVGTTIYNFRFHNFVDIKFAHTSKITSFSAKLTTFSAMRIRFALYNAFDGVQTNFNQLFLRAYITMIEYLEMLNFDIHDGITQPLQLYIRETSHSIQDILAICHKNEWNDLTMAILRLREEDGIRADQKLVL